MKDTWEIYKDVAKRWRWRRTAANGRIVGRSSQGYHNKEDCEDNALRNGWLKPAPAPPVSEKRQARST